MKVEFIKPENSDGFIVVHGQRYFFFSGWDTIKDAIKEMGPEKAAHAKPEDDAPPANWSTKPEDAPID
jgi:hypothetical protein